MKTISSKQKVETASDISDFKKKKTKVSNTWMVQKDIKDKFLH